MTAEVHAFSRPGGTARAPLVPATVAFKDEGIYLRSDPALLDSSWYRRCSAAEFRAANALRHRALKQQPAGSLPNDDNDLAFLSDNGLNVAAWKRVKARALEGWVLCSDDRWHHPDIARNVLHIWVGRLESRRIGSWGNVSRAKDGGLYGLDSILDGLDEALDALRDIDPQDVVLRKAAEQQSKWRVRLDQVRSGSLWETDHNADGAEPNRIPNRSPIRTPSGGDPKVRVGKPSLEDSSSLLRRDDSPDQTEEGGQEVGPQEGAADDLSPTPSRRERAPPWPQGWFERLKAPYPKREAWGRAEKAAERIRKTGRVPFDDVLAGVERLATRVTTGSLSLQYTPLMSTWLNDRGWEDEPGPCQPSGNRPPPRDAPPRPAANSRAAFATHILEQLHDRPYSADRHPPPARPHP